MPRTPTLVPGLRKVDLPEARQAIPALHAYLRQCVLDGTLTPGTKLSQVALADQLGVSRTPLREVLRMLQEEGLVEIEPNQRTRVAGLDPQELDDVYASRILLETLALSMTLDGFTSAHQREAKATADGDAQGRAYGRLRPLVRLARHFHRLITAGRRRLPATPADRVRGPDHQLHPDLSALRAGELAVRRRRRARRDPRGADRKRRSCRVVGSGAPPRPHGRAGADRLRAGLQDQCGDRTRSSSWSGAGAGASRPASRRRRLPRAASRPRETARRPP